MLSIFCCILLAVASCRSCSSGVRSLRNAPARYVAVQVRSGSLMHMYMSMLSRYIVMTVSWTCEIPVLPTLLASAALSGSLLLACRPSKMSCSEGPAMRTSIWNLSSAVALHQGTVEEVFRSRSHPCGNRWPSHSTFPKQPVVNPLHDQPLQLQRFTARAHCRRSR